MRHSLHITRLLLALVAGILAAPGAAADTPAIMVLMDGSGSMWGKLAGSALPKFAVAREALRQPLAGLAPGSRVGLASFGHRRRSDCTDTEVMLRPEAGDPGRLLTLLERLNPKGRGPISQALRDAAATLRPMTGPKQIVLIHDDTDNCNQDPCAAAQEIRAADPALRIDVVSLGVPADDPGHLACVATATKGRAFAAPTAAEVASAIAAVLAPAPPPPTPAPLPRVAPPPAASEAEILPQDGPPRLRLSAHLVKGSPRIETPVRWTVRSAESAGTAVLAQPTGPTPELPLPDGRYVVEARVGAVAAQAEIDVRPAGVTAGRIELDAGVIALTIRRYKGAPPSKTADVRLARPGDAMPLWVGRPGQLVVPAGRYQVIVRDSGIEAHRTVDVTVGATISIDLSLDAGLLRLSALATANGGPVDNVLYRVVEQDPEAADGLREVARSSAVRPEFLLPAGSYQAIARHANAEGRERIAITPGEELTRQIDLAMGRIRAAVMLAGSALEPRESIEIRVLQKAPVESEVLRTSRTDRPIGLGAGLYRLEARLGSQNAVSHRDIEVTAGAEQRIAIDIDASEVQLRLAEPLLALAAADIGWEVSDASGHVVWQSVQYAPRGYLKSGRYTASLQTRDARFERSFVVRAGGPITVTIGGD